MAATRSAPVVIAIGGSDPSGGAGVQADCRTLESFGVNPPTVVTAVTVQTGKHVVDVEAVRPAMVARQLRALLASRRVAAVKCGMLASAATVRAVVRELRGHDPVLVVDPVVTASGGERLGEPGLADSLRSRLFPLATIVTVNLAEAELFTGGAVSDEPAMEAAARALAASGARAVVVKGGHLRGGAVDVLWDGQRLRTFRARRTARRDMHGTGCAFASAVAAGLARRRSLVRSVADAGAHVRTLIVRASRTRDGAWLREPPGPATR